MNLDHKQAAELAKSISENTINFVDDLDIILCPSFTSIQSVADAIKNNPKLSLGAQNISSERSGAYTGEVSAEMLKPFGVKYVIIGHSERRQIIGETDDIVNEKLKLAIEEGFSPILCVGETLKERQRGAAKNIIEQQLQNGLRDLNSAIADIVVAYEPVWAIGTGKTATPDHAEDMSGFMRNVLEQLQNGVANKVRIQYGGSVTPENISSFMELDDIDGALVGGASLKADQFLSIIKYKEQEREALSS